MSTADAGNGSVKGVGRPVPPSYPYTPENLLKLWISAQAREDLVKVTGEAWQALRERNAPPRLFRQGQSIVAVREHDGRCVVAHLSCDDLRWELAQAAMWFVYDRNGDHQPARPPMDVARAMLSSLADQLPPLDGVAAGPVFDAAGLLRVESGYQASARLWVALDATLRLPAVPTEPSSSEIASAQRLLVEELLGDFPFAEQADRANCLALLLLPFVRPLIGGPTPLHLIEKPSPGTGASLLVDLLSLVATGRAAAAMTEAPNESEWRKQLTAKLMEGPTLVVLDNVNRLDSAGLSAAITAETWEDRVLGASKMVRLPVRCVWVAAGNNPRLSNELARRTVAIRLDAKQDRPWNRPASGFRHPDVRAWARQHRGDLLCAALTIIRAWMVAGRPLSGHTLGSMEVWAKTLGGILKVAGVAAFLDNAARFYDRVDDEGETWRAITTAWWDAHGDRPVGVGQLFELLAQGEHGLSLGNGNDKSQRTKLGRLLKRVAGRVFGSLRIEPAGKRQGAAQWQLVNLVNLVNLGEPSDAEARMREPGELAREVHEVHEVHGLPRLPDEEGQP